MSGAEVAGLIVAMFWGILVVFLAYVLIRLGAVLREATRFVSGMTDRTLPILNEMTVTVSSTNAQLARVDTITSNVQTLSTNASAMSSLFAATMGSPVVRVAAFSFGVRKALGERDRRGIERRVKAEIKAERKQRRATRAATRRVKAEVTS